MNEEKKYFSFFLLQRSIFTAINFKTSKEPKQLEKENSRNLMKPEQTFKSQLRNTRKKMEKDKKKMKKRKKQKKSNKA